MVQYTQITEIERVTIFNLRTGGLGPRAIGKAIDRRASSISRELKRNSDHIGYLYPRDAHQMAKNRKAKNACKIDKNLDLKAYIMEMLKINYWPPGVIAGRWSLENPEKSITGEAIYTWIYHPKNKKLALWQYLPKGKKRRGRVRKKQSKSTIMHRVSIHNRSQKINDRKELGHYEADLMFTQGTQSANILTVVERVSRKVTLIKHESKKSKPIIESIKNSIGSIARSCTFDNGTEFSLHYLLSMPTFFCDPGSPWQKGSVENINGQTRAYVPFKLDPSTITQEYLDHVAQDMNSKPRKILNFLTPDEVFNGASINEIRKKESRMKIAIPATEEVFYQSLEAVALHI